ncbi:MAG: hypothetical protein L3J45_03020 [Flavobacteriaceae bacterium]|nr:hypothetical protein [Flavobacteriaceae bacterium]
MEIKKITYPLPGEYYNKQIFHIENEGLDIQFGTVFLKKGTRIPEKGVSRHPQIELSVIQEGKIEMLNEDGSVKGYLNKGDVVCINALEAQAGNVLTDTKIIYTLIENN